MKALHGGVNTLPYSYPLTVADHYSCEKFVWR